MAKQQAKTKFQDTASYFATKIEAEWGPYDLKHALDSNPKQIVVLDTRDADSFAEEHLPQAINIPEAELTKRLKELPDNKEIVPYCWNITCHLATRVALALSLKGFRVHELVGGIEAWKKAEFEVVSSKKETATVA
jgi:rhodanese-related sulfurtransferase